MDHGHDYRAPFRSGRSRLESGWRGFFRLADGIAIDHKITGVKAPDFEEIASGASAPNRKWTGARGHGAYWVCPADLAALNQGTGLKLPEVSVVERNHRLLPIKGIGMAVLFGSCAPIRF
jgi:hypothetical protein